MIKIREIYRCPICGNIVEILHEGAELTCCGKPMQRLRENIVDASYEKHVPVVEAVEGGFRVRVGNTDHPMADEHYIQWVELLTPRCVLRRELHPHDKPEAIFLLDKTTACGTMAQTCSINNVVARAYCNLHGLWKM